MSQLEYKSLPLELSDLSREHRTAVIAHATYDNIDRVGDVCRKGMFTRTWNNNKGDIQFRINHNPLKQPGKVMDVWEDDKHGYTKVFFANTTLGNDTLEMMDQGIIKDASFGFRAIKKNEINIKGKKVRELKEVFHGETSAVFGIPAINPESGVVMVTKAFDPEILPELKLRIDQLEEFCRDTTASDECIIHLQQEIKALHTIISGYDTADTPDGDPAASATNDEAFRRLISIKARLCS